MDALRSIFGEALAISLMIAGKLDEDTLSHMLFDCLTRGIEYVDRSEQQKANDDSRSRLTINVYISQDEYSSIEVDDIDEELNMGNAQRVDVESLVKIITLLRDGWVIETLDTHQCFDDKIIKKISLIKP